jgi:hypothetical protein
MASLALVAIWTFGWIAVSAWAASGSQPATFWSEFLARISVKAGWMRPKGLIGALACMAISFCAWCGVLHVVLEALRRRGAKLAGAVGVRGATYLLVFNAWVFCGWFAILTAMSIDAVFWRTMLAASQIGILRVTLVWPALMVIWVWVWMRSVDPRGAIWRTAVVTLAALTLAVIPVWEQVALWVREAIR